MSEPAPPFSTLGLSPGLLAALAAAGITDPTPIQAQAIPAVRQGRDVIGLAQTGTGKTLAFALPLVDRLGTFGHPPGPRQVRILVLEPTRELATQVRDAVLPLVRGGAIGLRLAVGGVSVDRQAEGLARGADILVATPGRLVDLLDRGAVSLGHLAALVLDEADMMLSLGFLPALRRIGRDLPLRRQTLMFTATFPDAIAGLARDWLRDPLRIEAAPPGRVAAGVAQAVHFVSNRDKARVLSQLLRTHPAEAALVFCRTREGAEKLGALLAGWGLPAVTIHGDRSHADRMATLAGFRAQAAGVLVATDLAARGLDLPAVRHVYNLDLPLQPETYVHRVGRTARAGAEGRAVSLVAPADMAALAAIETAQGAALPVASGSRWSEAQAAPRRRAPPPARAPESAGQPKPPARPGAKGGEAPPSRPAGRPPRNPTSNPPRNPSGPRGNR
jgi:ATP-dependent RNA helicase RhlE